jgi:hypothetical protein
MGIISGYESELISKRTKACLVSAGIRGRSELCKELGITRVTLYRFVIPKGDFRDDARKLMA